MKKCFFWFPIIALVGALMSSVMNTNKPISSSTVVREQVRHLPIPSSMNGEELFYYSFHLLRMYADAW